MMWYCALLPPLVSQLPSQIGMKTTVPWRAFTEATIWPAQLFPLSEFTSVGNWLNWIFGGFVTSSSHVRDGSRSRIMNDPPPVLHKGTMYSCPTGGVPGLLICQLASPVPRVPFWLQSTMFTGNTVGMNA